MRVLLPVSCDPKKALAAVNPIAQLSQAEKCVRRAQDFVSGRVQGIDMKNQHLNDFRLPPGRGVPFAAKIIWRQALARETQARQQEPSQVTEHQRQAEST
jgi:hypothetical protein